MLSLIFKAHHLAANLACQRQFQPERVVNLFYQIAFQILEFARASTDRADFHVSVIRVGVLDFVMHAPREAIKAALASRRGKLNDFLFAARESRKVIAHMKSM